jgi:hypothetical protein
MSTKTTESSQFASKPDFSVVGFLVIGLLTSAENVNLSQISQLWGFLVIGLLTSAENVNLSGNWYRSIGYAIDQ